MITSRLDGLRNMVGYYTELVRAGRTEYIEKLICAQGRLSVYSAFRLRRKKSTLKKKEKANVMEKVKKIIQAKIKHNEARLLWKKDIDFTNMSHAARSFSAGQASTWVSEIYFLKGMLEEMDKKDSGLLE